MIKDNLLVCNQVAGGGDAKANSLPALIVPISVVAVSAVLVALQHRTRPQKEPPVQAAGPVAHCRPLRRHAS